jgi:hypothetical protein
MMMRLGRVHEAEGRAAARKELSSAVALYAAAKFPGYVHDLIEDAEVTGLLSAHEGRELRTQIDHVFRWARLDSGLSRVGGLIDSVVRVLSTHG